MTVRIDDAYIVPAWWVEYWSFAHGGIILRHNSGPIIKNYRGQITTRIIMLPARWRWHTLIMIRRIVWPVDFWFEIFGAPIKWILWIDIQISWVFSSRHRTSWWCVAPLDMLFYQCHIITFFWISFGMAQKRRQRLHLLLSRMIGFHLQCMQISIACLSGV